MARQLRVMFASFDYLREKDTNVSLATSSILAHLKKSFGMHQTDQLYRNKELEINHFQYNVKNAKSEDITNTFLKDFNQCRPEVLATGVYIWNEAFVQNVMASLNTTTVTTVLGGPQITYNPKGTLNQHYPYGDIFIRGYAEQSFDLLLRNLISNNHSSQIQIDGVHFKGSQDLGIKSVYNMDTLESPLLTGVVNRHHGYTRLETKRGCPFTCAFCQHKDSYEKRLSSSLSRIYKEIEWIMEQGIRDISIVDPIFNSGVDKNYLNILKRFFELKYVGRLSLQSRFEMVGDEYLVGCSNLLEEGAQLELEFGIQTINAEESKIIRRKNNLRKVASVADQLRAHGIPFEVSLIYGLPMQTVDSFKRGIEWVKEFLKPNVIHAWPLMLLKGTEMYDLRGKHGLIEKVLDEQLEEVDTKRQYAGIPHVVQSSSFTEEDWHKMKDIALTL